MTDRKIGRKIDVRGLDHQDRPPRIMGEASKLKPGEHFTLVVEIEPVPMIRMLEQRGFTCKTEKIEEGHFEVNVSKGV